MKKLVALVVTTTLIVGNTMPIINVYAQSNNQNTIKEIAIKSTVEVRNIEELQAAIDSAEEGTLIKIYEGTYNIDNLEIKNKPNIILQGCNRYGNPIVTDLTNAPTINGKLDIDNQSGITIEGLKINNLSIGASNKGEASSNIIVRSCSIADKIYTSGNVIDTNIESTEIKNLSIIHGTNITLKKVKASLDIGNTQNLSIEDSNLGHVYLGGMMASKGAKGTNINNSSIAVLKTAYQGKAYDSNIRNSTIEQCYIGDTQGLSNNMLIENSKINNNVLIGHNGTSENTTIKGCSIKGEVQVGNGNGTSKNTKLIENLYEKDSFGREGIKIGNENAIAQGTTVVNTRDDRLIGGGVEINKGINTLLIGDEINYTTTENSVNTTALKEIKEPGNILKGTSYNGARIEIKSQENTNLDQVLTTDGEFELNLNPNVNNEDNLIINIYDTNNNLANSIDLIVDTRLSIPISTKEDLDKIRENLYATYHLEQNIVFTESDFEPGGAFYNQGKGWNPIGAEYKSPYKGTFKGTLDGNGFEIKGLKVDKTNYAGLFATNEGTIRNLGIVDSDIKANSTYDYQDSGSVYAGAIAAFNTGTIENCYNLSSVFARNDGGRNKDNAGGIAGENKGGKILNCYNKGKVSINSSAQQTNVGGIVGANRGEVSKSYNTGAIDINKTRSINSLTVHAGGISGGVYEGGSTDQCYNKGDIKLYNKLALYTNKYIGGIVGYNTKSLTNSYNIGTIESKDEESSGGYLAGIAGYNDRNIENCYSITTLISNDKQISDRIVAVSGTWETGSIESSYCVDEKTTIEDFLNQSTFKGFDFNNIWTMNGNKDYLYPELQNVNMEFTKEFLGIEIASEPTKKEYIETEELDTSGLVVKAKYNNGSKEEITDYTISGYTSTPGTKTIKIGYKGKVVTFEVIVKENNAPIIQGKDISIKVGDILTDKDLLSLVKATDIEDGEITNKITIKENNLDTTKPGKYTVLYEVVDTHGKTGTKTIQITVNEKLSNMNNIPTINASDFEVNVGDKFDALSKATAHDKEDGDISNLITVVEDTVNTAKPGEYKITYKITDSQGASATKTIKVIVKNVFVQFTVNNIDSKATTITGKGEQGAKVEAYVGSNKIGNTVTVDSSGNYKITIPAQKTNTNIVVKMSKPGYQTIQKSIKVLGIVSNFTKKLTTDIYRYDIGKGNHLTYINGKGYSQYSYLNKDGRYAFTPSSWMVAAGLNVSMPTSSNNYTMTIDNNYIGLYNDAKQLLDKMNQSGHYSIEEIKNELNKIEKQAQKIEITNITPEKSTKSTPKKTLTKDIYRYDAGSGKHLTYINGKGYSQYSYLNQDGRYAFTPSSWMKAAGLEVSMPTSSNGYKMYITNPYITKYNDVVKEIKSYIK